MAALSFLLPFFTKLVIFNEIGLIESGFRHIC